MSNNNYLSEEEQFKEILSNEEAEKKKELMNINNERIRKCCFNGELRNKIMLGKMAVQAEIPGLSVDSGDE